MRSIVSEKEKWHYFDEMQGKGAWLATLPAEVCFLKVEGELQGKQK